MSILNVCFACMYIFVHALYIHLRLFACVHQMNAVCKQVDICVLNRQRQTGRQANSATGGPTDRYADMQSRREKEKEKTWFVTAKAILVLERR